MTEYFTTLLLELAEVKVGTELTGKPASFYEELLAQEVKKIVCEGWDYANFDEARFNVDLIYNMSFIYNGETWVEQYTFDMNHELNALNKVLTFQETL